MSLVCCGNKQGQLNTMREVVLISQGVKWVLASIFTDGVHVMVLSVCCSVIPHGPTAGKEVDEETMFGVGDGLVWYINKLL